MPAQGNRGLSQPWFHKGIPQLSSGVRKVFLRTRSKDKYAYAFYSRMDDHWYDANGHKISNKVISYTELGR